MKEFTESYKPQANLVNRAGGSPTEYTREHYQEGILGDIQHRWGTASDFARNAFVGTLVGAVLFAAAGGVPGIESKIEKAKDYISPDYGQHLKYEVKSLEFSQPINFESD